MYAYKTTQPINRLHVEIDLPAEFSDCVAAEIIVLPVAAPVLSQRTWEDRVMALAGIMGDDFPDDISDADLGEDSPREALE